MMVLPSSTRPLEEAEDRVGGLGVEVAGGLVGGEDRRVVGERAGDGDALLLAAGERGGQLVRLVGHLDLLEQVQRALGPLGGREHVAEVHRQHDVLDDGQRGQQLEELEHDADGLAAPDRELVLVELVHRRAVDDDRARRGPVDAGDHVDERRLARSPTCR